MAHYDDLDTWDGVGIHALAVGWLEPGVEYARGAVDETFFRKLVQLLERPWQPAATAGRHPCGFCAFTGGPGVLRYEDVQVRLGASMLIVPGADALYVSPSMIAHYIDAHEYSPPAEYVSAVLQCPRMRSIEYLEAMRRHGVRVSAANRG